MLYRWTFIGTRCRRNIYYLSRPRQVNAGATRAGPGGCYCGILLLTHMTGAIIRLLVTIIRVHWNKGWENNKNANLFEVRQKGILCNLWAASLAELRVAYIFVWPLGSTFSSVDNIKQPDLVIKSVTSHYWLEYHPIWTESSHIT